jgi:myo-inositol-1(or 4)-monophosphatase
VDNREVIVDRIVNAHQNLADFLKLRLEKICKIFTQYSHPTVTYKPDHSPVTQLDLAFSQYFEDLFSQHYSNLTFYSEEKFSAWKFPLIALDPLDGTREYVNGNPEWAISIGLFESEDFKGEGWVYNPATQEIFDHGLVKSFEKKLSYRGEVSRSESGDGFFKNTHSERFQIHPVGSIAYKLGRLSKHKCDFVVSLRPKNIWDVAGGTLLCHQAGMTFYSQGKEVTKVQKSYAPPLIWCHPSLFLELSALFE